MPILHVSYAFAEAPESTLNEFTTTIQNNIYGKAAFPQPPVAAATLADQLLAFNNALAEAATGGPAATATKNAARDVLIDSLRQLAGYVDERHKDQLATLLSSGFQSIGSNRFQTSLPKAVIKKITHAGVGRLLVEADTLANVKSWQAQWKPDGAAESEYRFAENLAAIRKMILTNLPELTRINIQMRGVGGNTGYGEWSDAVTHAVT